MQHVWYFLQVTLYPLAAILVCGLAVWACQRLFVKLLGGGVGFKIVMGSSIIGTPVHELGHAIMCPLFGHKITKLVLWQPRTADGTLGYVNHTCNPRNLYHRLGDLFIGVGPIFSGLAVLSASLFFAFPNTWNAYFTSAVSLVESNASVADIFLSGLHILPNMIAEFGSASFPIWGRILLVLVMLSVSLHINLSPADIKGALSALPLYLGLALLVTVITTLIGTAATKPVLAGLEVFNAFMMAVFTVVLVFAALLGALALLVWLLRRLFSLIRK